MAIDLYFDLPAVLRLAEHASAAHDHLLSFSEREAGQTRGVPALEWVADEGAYLMSNGLPALREQHAPQQNVVVYADGWEPGSNRRELGASEVGHDDFVEHFPLADADPTLLALLRAANTQGYQWFVLTVDTGHVAYRVSKTRRSK